MLQINFIDKNKKKTKKNARSVISGNVGLIKAFIYSFTHPQHTSTDSLIHSYGNCAMCKSSQIIFGLHSFKSR